MDKIRWKEGEFEVRRPAEDIEKALNSIKKKDLWILEGVFGKMAQDCLPFSTILIWLDLPWEECKQNLFRRGPQFEDCLTLREKEKALVKLVHWASAHWSRDDPNSWSFFNKLYTNFQSNRIRLQNRADILAFFNREYEK
jgi:deoxyadenosine/deoxycytidine kinase